MSTSTSDQPSVQQDYKSEAHAKFPPPLYPWEVDYNDSVIYKCYCKKYKDVKLKILDKHDAWVEQKQVADDEHAAVFAVVTSMMLSSNIRELYKNEGYLT